MKRANSLGSISQNSACQPPATAWKYLKLICFGKLKDSTNDFPTGSLTLLSVYVHFLQLKMITIWK